jgi:hypothetical protein
LIDFTFESANFVSFEALEDSINKSADDKVCFAVVFDDWDKSKKSFKMSFRYATIILPATNIDPYNPLQKSPKITDWEQWKGSGAPQLYQIISSSILFAYYDAIPTINLGMVPYKSRPFVDLPNQILSQLSLVFPLYLMFTFLLPLFYIISKLGEEKESKAREGMKMMGLSDSTYFLSWFIFHVCIILVQAAEVALVTAFNVFPNSNPFLIFIWCFLYGLCIFSFCICVTALVSGQSAASTAGTLLWVISFFLVFIVNGAKVSVAVKTIFSILPNIALSLGVNTLFYLELQAGGLNFATSSLMYQNYSFSIGLGMLTVFAVFFSLLGFYLD